MSSRNKVYVARRDCGCIVAAFPITIDKAVKGELLKQLAKAGLDIEQATDIDVRCNFNLACDHNKPPLQQMWEKKADPNDDGGVGQEDVDALGSEVDPDDEEALDQLAEEDDISEGADLADVDEGAAAEEAHDQQEAEELAAELAASEVEDIPY